MERAVEPSGPVETYIESRSMPKSNIPASGHSFDLLIIEIHVNEATTAATNTSKTVVARPGSMVVVGTFQRPSIFPNKYRLGGPHTGGFRVKVMPGRECEVRITFGSLR
jgi:uncharacterized membrane protein